MRDKNNNNRHLRYFMKQYKLSRKDVAGVLCVNPSTVDRWCQPKTKGGKPNTTYRPVPDMAIKLLETLEEAGQLEVITW